MAGKPFHMPDPVDLTGHAALVTGGTRGIGRGIAERLLGAGAEVAVCGRERPDELPEVGGRAASFFAADVREPEQVDGLLDAVVGRLGRLDVAVNGAGGSPVADTATAPAPFSRSVVALNLLAPLSVAQAANRVMQDQEAGGVIVNVASVAGLRASPGLAAFGAAKAGLIGVTRTLAMEWGPKVRVNAVSPGTIAAGQPDADGGQRLPLGRAGTPGDVADAVLYLASPLSAFVTGANLVVDGGGERPAYLEAIEG